MQAYGSAPRPQRRRTDLRVRPRDLTDRPYDWLNGKPLHLSADYAQRFARAVNDARGTRTTRVLAEEAGVSHSIVGNVLAGRAWPDFRTVARLEHALGVALWPGVDLLLRDLRRKRAALADCLAGREAG